MFRGGPRVWLRPWNIELLDVFLGKKEKAQIIEFTGKNKSRLENSKFGPSLGKPILVD